MLKNQAKTMDLDQKDMNPTKKNVMPRKRKCNLLYNGVIKVLRISTVISPLTADTV